MRASPLFRHRGVSRGARVSMVVSMGALFVALVSGCATPPPPQATVVSVEQSFDEAANAATDGLIAQVGSPGFMAKNARRAIVVDPMLDAGGGQQTAATQRLEKRVSGRLTTQSQSFEMMAFQSANLSRAQYLLTGTMARAQPDRKNSPWKLNLALTELKTGIVVAQASALARDDGLDSTPLPYFRDSPILLKDKVVAGYIATSMTSPGKPADAFYLERIATATLINEATALYDQERYVEALGQYRSALAMPQGDQLRVVNGIYLANWKLGRLAEAEQAFGRVVALGIAYNELGVKFLFNPGSTEFWSDTRVSGPYAMWLRQIGREGNAAKVCMNIVGHTSRTGSEQVNDALSLQRATAIRQKLAAEAPALAARSKVSGMGWHDNIVGSGTDNAADALDRRVEFKIVGCG